MLKRKRIMCLMLPLIFITPSTVTPFPEARQLIENKVDKNEMVLKTNKLGLLIDPIQEQIEKDRKEFKKKKAEELKLQKEKELEEQRKNEIKWQEFVLTFYTSLDMENGYGAITCEQKPLSRGMVANNVYSLGTQIYLEEYGVRTVADHGGENFNLSHRLDVFVARRDGEEDYQYRKRALSYGEQHVRGYIVK